MSAGLDVLPPGSRLAECWTCGQTFYVRLPPWPHAFMPRCVRCGGGDVGVYADP